MPGLDLRCVWLGVLALLWAGGALADMGEGLRAEGWREVTFDGKMPNRFAQDEAGIVVESEGSVSLLQRPVEVDLAMTPRLTWRWRATSSVPPTDLTVKGEDDRALALYVAFPFVPEEASVMERMKRAVVETVAGEEAPGRVLMYVWGGDGERGDRVRSPHLGASGMMTILRPASVSAEGWFEESVDLADDYRMIFGSEPPDPLYVAIGADTDDTETKVEGVVADLGFVSRANVE